ncbi:Type 1 glutamine amidotransferase-like domain-containing protein [Rhabdothermincola salaria]|uniref:Type 1 glutamine amidotransferase-like domain-containing protein n=1 Tax=Rhabdothermincola salaria TaxID=2903142 RepID=UPI001E4EB6C3|nr:Type 1 glutamine amidotransferase-like domain-containing protein [Rhabdothermincola salaria]MCD9625406.1 Type 1 glutamine amidotransferase-like domain-containing protein [Rhabdothermincola salaria]
MTGLLALVGGGEFTAGCEFDTELLEASGGAEVALLPTGLAYEGPQRAVEAATSWFGDLGAEVREVPVYSRADALVAEHVEVIRRARFVYMVGTSPMHLRSVLKDTPLFTALVDAWHDGAVLAGSGAGADVLCDPMVDTRGGAFTVGLGVVPGVAVIPRADTWSPDKVRRTVELAPPSLHLVSLPERSGIVRDPDGTWRSIGDGLVTVHHGGHQATLADLPADTL